MAIAGAEHHHRFAPSSLHGQKSRNRSPAKRRADGALPEFRTRAWQLAAERGDRLADPVAAAADLPPPLWFNSKCGEPQVGLFATLVTQPIGLRDVSRRPSAGRAGVPQADRSPGRVQALIFELNCEVIEVVGSEVEVIVRGERFSSRSVDERGGDAVLSGGAQVPRVGGDHHCLLG